MVPEYASGCQAGTPALKPHAVSAAGAHSFSYDCNGNMTTRTITSTVYNLAYDAENRLVSASGAATASFVYDGDGARVKGVIGGVTTVYIGSLYEWTGSSGTAKRYYYAGAARVAVREGSTLYYLLGDHLGSTSKTANASGGLVAELRYTPWGVERCCSGGTTPTSIRFTGQRLESGLDGLYFYNARWYDSLTARFISADTIVPGAGNPQALNRYSYVLGNPTKYTDPTGHRPDNGCEIEGCHQDPVGGNKTPALPSGLQLDDPPPPGTGPLNWARDFLEWLGVDAVGLRLNGSAGAKVGGSVSMDGLYNLNTDTGTWFVSGGGQAATVGGSASVGVLLVWGLPDNQGYTGWSGGPTGSVAEGFVGVDASLSIAKDQYNGERPIAFYLGYAGGTEVTAGVAASHTWTLERVLQWATSRFP